MSFFSVTIETLKSVNPHTNADSLELGELNGLSFQFVLRKDSFTVGDEVVYFPVDSVLPRELAIAVGMKLKDNDNTYRMRTVRLRGEISQGLVVKLSQLVSITGKTIDELKALEQVRDEALECNELTKLLGVYKYELPISGGMARDGISRQLPSFLSKYDIESTQRYDDVFTALVSEPFIVLEKLEGSNFSITYSKPDDEVYICSRNLSFALSENTEAGTNTWVDTAKSYNLHVAVKQYALEQGYDRFTVYGELVGNGMNGNIYGFGDVRIMPFDVKINDQFIAYEDFEVEIDELNLHLAKKLVKAPVLLRWERSGVTEDAKDAVDKVRSGPSMISVKPKYREGIVIRPLFKERNLKQGEFKGFAGRMFLKFRDPIYLDATGN